MKFCLDRALAATLVTCCGLAGCATASAPSTAAAPPSVVSPDASLVRQPEVVIRAQDPDEAFDYLMYTLGKMPFFRKNGYVVALPEHATFQALAKPDARLEDADQAPLRAVFTSEVYRKDDFTAGLRALDGMPSVLRGVFPVFASFEKKWGFKVFPRYEVVLTLYGPGGSYDADRGRVTVFTTREGKFKQAHAIEGIVHEMVHMGIEDILVKRFGLEHWEKEGVVDRVCSVGLHDALPGYVVQSKGTPMLDEFVTEASLDDLPAAIARYEEAKRGR